MSSSEHAGPENPWERIRSRAGGPGGQTHLATVGTWLRQDGVSTRDLPGGRLLPYLARFPTYCRVEGPPTRQLVLFGDGPPPPTPSLAAKGEGSSATGGLALRSDLWRAMVADHPARAWFLDVGSLAIVSAAVVDGQPDEPVAGQEWRYLRVPTLSSDAQREQARTVLAGLVGDQAADEICADGHWLRRVNGELAPVQRERVLAARSQWVVQQAIDWLEAHGQPLRKLVHERPARSDRLAVPQPDISDLRRAVHRAVDRMSADELSALLIPSRLLV